MLPARSRPGHHRTSGRSRAPSGRPSLRQEAQRRRRRESRARPARRGIPVAAAAALITAVVVWQLSSDGERAPQRTDPHRSRDDHPAGGFGDGHGSCDVDNPAVVLILRNRNERSSSAPGVGQEVADKLVGRGFRVALGGNAQNFTHKTTEIITYDASEAGIAAAERVKDLLGVGQVLVSAQEQGIVSVDLTIVVGKDFLRTR